MLLKLANALFNFLNAIQIVTQGLTDPGLETAITKVIQADDRLASSALVTGLRVGKGKLLSVRIALKECVSLLREFAEGVLTFLNLIR